MQEQLGSDLFRRLRRHKKSNGSCFTKAWKKWFKEQYYGTVRYGTARRFLIYGTEESVKCRQMVRLSLGVEEDEEYSSTVCIGMIEGGSSFWWAESSLVVRYDTVQNSNSGCLIPFD